MTEDLTNALQMTFDEAVMRHEARSLKEGQHWEQAREIMERGEGERAALEDIYLREYDSRVETVRKRLVDDAGKPDLNHPAPYGRDKFDSETLTRQAHREVRSNHDADLQQSLDAQRTELDGLQEKARQTDRPQGKARDDFTQASDRRQGPDRRAPSRSP